MSKKLDEFIEEISAMLETSPTHSLRPRLVRMCQEAHSSKTVSKAHIIESAAPTAAPAPAPAPAPEPAPVAADPA